MVVIRLKRKDPRDGEKTLKGERRKELGFALIVIGGAVIEAFDKQMTARNQPAIRQMRDLMTDGVNDGNIAIHVAREAKIVFVLKEEFGLHEHAELLLERVIAR
jgi:hypothetical protein